MWIGIVQGICDKDDPADVVKVTSVNLSHRYLTLLLWTISEQKSIAITVYKEFTAWHKSSAEDIALNFERSHNIQALQFMKKHKMYKNKKKFDELIYRTRKKIEYGGKKKYIDPHTMTFELEKP